VVVLVILIMLMLVQQGVQVVLVVIHKLVLCQEVQEIPLQ
tara:strand:+ start:188 stop:307 length:120 start_codon:yes stop_codon:yes gene_type:complete